MKYYNIEDDIAAYPDAWCIIAFSGRNTGKTYSCLKSCVTSDRPFTFLKRTMDDIDLLCAGSGKLGTKKQQYGVDLSPFKSVNRDIGTNVTAFSIHSGLGAFFDVDEEGKPNSGPVGYALALSAVNKFKGFDLSDTDWIIFDEFVPQPWERVNRKEGEQVLDLYKTISRDREQRGRPALKLICLANAVRAKSPLTDTLELTDMIVDMDMSDQEYLFIKDRGILLHRIKMNEEFMDVERNSSIYKAMAGTQWADMALENHFGYDDFSQVRRMSIKKMRCQCRLKYKKKSFYIYSNGDVWYMCQSPSNTYLEEYDLNVHSQQKAFYNYLHHDYLQLVIDGCMFFSSYTAYSLIYDYKDFFKV